MDTFDIVMARPWTGVRGPGDDHFGLRFGNTFDRAVLAPCQRRFCTLEWVWPVESVSKSRAPTAHRHVGRSVSLRGLRNHLSRRPR
jgi:hypothetical protein